MVSIRGMSRLLVIAVWYQVSGVVWADILSSPVTPSRIRIASYNVLNLWDADPTNSGSSSFSELSNSRSSSSLSLSWFAKPASRDAILYHDFDPNYSNWYDPAILSKKVDSLLQAVRWMGVPDILAAQEIESAYNQSRVQEIPYGTRSSLGEEMRKLGYNYFYLGHQAEDNPVSVTPAIWSKIPLQEEDSVNIYFESSPHSSRHVQVMRGKVGTFEFLIFNSHWKSKNGAGSGDLRTQTAKAVRERMNQEQTRNPELGFLLVGDFNSEYYEEPILALGATGDVKSMVKGTPDLLYNLWMQVPADKRWEFSFDGLGGTLSQILLSHHFFHGTLRYVDHSFSVVGQDFTKAGGLMGPDGTPYAWQSYQEGDQVHFIGRGYSDHLPLVAEFEVVSATTKPQYALSQEALVAPQSLRFDKVPVCRNEPVQDIHQFNATSLEAHLGECVQVDLPAGEAALPLSTRGKYRGVYVSLQDTVGQTFSLSLTMSRKWDWRPNVDDSRVNQASILSEVKGFSTKSEHPHSNKCVQRKWLQGNGGALRHVVGRLGYVDGFLSVIVATREAKDLILEKLPASKQKACVW
jgi:hypothetical protein